MKVKNMLLLIIVVGSLAFISYKTSYAFLKSTANSKGNLFVASDVFSEATITLTPTLSPGTFPSVSPSVTPTTSVVAEGDVVINELNWAGSNDNVYDEWIELRNMTGEEINLSGWQMTRLVESEKLMLTIPEGKTIPAYGYFLISDSNKDNSKINVEPDIVDSRVVLRNKDLQIKLYKGDWRNLNNLIDTADDGKGSPFAGSSNIPKRSMERKDPPGDGSLSDNWQDGNTHVNMDDDGPGSEFGSPKAQNAT